MVFSLDHRANILFNIPSIQSSYSSHCWACLSTHAISQYNIRVLLADLFSVGEASAKLSILMVLRYFITQPHIADYTDKNEKIRPICLMRFYSLGLMTEETLCSQWTLCGGTRNVISKIIRALPAETRSWF